MLTEQQWRLVSR